VQKICSKILWAETNWESKYGWQILEKCILVCRNVNCIKLT
jgi:hypothetical protein